MVCIYSYATTSNYAVVVSRAIRHAWQNHRPKKGTTRISITLPVPIYVRIWGEMKSTRCHKHKSYYTINIKDITRPNSYNESTIRVECNEETLKIQIWDDDHHVFVTRAVNVVNCFEHPEIVWDCMKGVLQI